MMTLARTAHYVTIVAVYDEIDLALPSATWGIAFVLWLQTIGKRLRLREKSAPYGRPARPQSSEPGIEPEQS